jgi:hypothetical protein
MSRRIGAQLVLPLAVAVLVASWPAVPARAGTAGMNLDLARGELAIVGAGVDAVSASAQLPGTRAFWAKLDNATAGPVTNPTVILNSGYPPAGFVANTQLVSAFPLRLSAASIPAATDGLFLGLDTPLPVTGAPGFDSSRSVDQLDVPLAGLRQTTSVSVTLTDPRYAAPTHLLKLTIDSLVPGASLVALVPPTLTGPGDSVKVFPGTNGGQFVLQSGTRGHTYVFTAVLQIPNPVGVVFAHKPRVHILSLIQSVPVCTACGPQTSIALPEPLLDGPVAGSGGASASIDQTLTWSTGYTDTYTVQYSETSLPAHAGACTSSVGPGIPPPASVLSGLPGFHAAWYGQSGYMTLCPGDAMTATVAMYNSGSNGWVKGVLGQVGYLGTWSPIPGQDQPSALGGDGQLGSPNTGWPRYNRVAIQPADYVGPNQVSWFQFGIRAPQIPGTYDLYIRPLIEGAQWMEDYGIFWRITVPEPAVAPTVTGATRIDANNVRVSYSKPMTGGSSGTNSAGNTTNYQVNNLGQGNLCQTGGTATITATADLKQFTITCAGAAGVWGASGNTLTVRNAADSNGNVITPNPSSVAF